MKWTEAQLINRLVAIANLCRAGLLNQNTKEAALEDSLDEAGWTRAELQDLNRRRQAINN